MAQEKAQRGTRETFLLTSVRVARRAGESDGAGEDRLGAEHMPHWVMLSALCIAIGALRDTA